MMNQTQAPLPGPRIPHALNVTMSEKWFIAAVSKHQ